jgi:hypothetical protein
VKTGRFIGLSAHCQIRRIGFRFSFFLFLWCQRERERESRGRGGQLGLFAWIRYNGFEKSIESVNVI